MKSEVVIPVEGSIAPLKHFKNAWKKKKIVLVCSTILATVAKDYYFDLWSHQYVYKYKSPEIGRQLYLEYAAGEVKTEWEFQKRLQELEVTDNG